MGTEMGVAAQNADFVPIFRSFAPPIYGGILPQIASI